MAKTKKGFEESIKIVGGDGSIFEIDLKKRKQAVKELSSYEDIFKERGKINQRLAKFLSREQKIVYEKDF